MRTERSAHPRHPALVGARRRELGGAQHGYHAQCGAAISANGLWVYASEGQDPDTGLRKLTIEYW